MDEKDYKKASEARSSRIKEYAVKIGMAFMSAVEELLKVIRGFTLPDEGVMFSFDSLPQAKREEVEKRLRHLHSVAKAITEDGMKAEWLKSEEFNDELVKQMTGVVKGNPELAGWFERNNQARNAFINRKVNGLNLSGRIWKTVKQLREEMEVAVTVSMGEGESAASMSRKVRNYLNDPDLMFRRFRYKAGEDEEGNPIYRKKWKKRVKDEATGRYKFVDYDKDSYKVGRGYYKSSTMNAMRVTRTETNMAYRMADHDRWQRLDFVIGQRIKTSKNHKEKDLCDDLAGDYPKDFTFTGWHPQCMCYCTPIMLEPKEVFRMSRAKLEGKPIKPSRGPVTEYPEGFRKWVSDNSEYIARKRAEGKEPYFVRDNAEVVDNILEERENYFNALSSSLSERLKPTPIKDVSEVEDVLKNVVDRHPEYFKRGFKGLKGVSEDHAYMSTSMDGLIKINFASNKFGYNAGESLVSAIKRIKKGEAISREEEYSIEQLWHEILHNKSANKTILSHLEDKGLGFTRATAETINQLIARNSYDEFLREIGGKAKFKDWIMTNGYSYNDSVTNLRELLKTARINERDFIKEAEAILMKDYAEIDKRISYLLVKMYKGKGDLKWAFGMIELYPKSFNSVCLKILRQG
jgi:hypothetical protein